MYAYCILLLGLYSTSAYSKGLDCDECFSTELISYTEEDNYLTIELEINGNNCNHALSHFTVEIPCGTVTDASNSEGWPMEINSTDATTNIHGLKVDDITDFAEDGNTDSFTLTYTVFAEDDECLNRLKYEAFKIAYKAGTCISTDDFILENNKLNATISAKHNSCAGDNEGQIDVEIINGTAPFSFQWSNGAITEDLDNLTSGTYSVTITDANNEQLILEAVITEPNAITSNAQIVHAHCGLSDGAIEVSISGGQKPYSYQWNTDETYASISNLSGGNYTLTVTDNIGCVKVFSYSIIDQTDLTASISTNVIECHEDGNGSLTVDVQGGTAPYTYLWDNGETTASISGLSSGSYNVNITDANGCTISKTGYVVVEKISVNSVVTEPTCFGASDGKITLNISNGTEPYETLWNTSDTSMEITSLSEGWYWVDITDAMGCETRKYVKVKEPKEISLSATVSRSSCNEADSAIVVGITASGGTAPYEIYHKDQLIDTEITIYETGYYEFTAIDAISCSVTQSIFIDRPDTGLDISVFITQPTCNNSLGSANITINGGSEPYAVSWSDGATTLNRNDLNAGNYLIEIEDAIGCQFSESISIDAILIPSVKINTPTTPLCGSSGNILSASTTNATHYKWVLSDQTNSWQVQSESADQITYTAGQGEAIASLTVESADGCKATDTVLLGCQADDSTNPDDGNIDDCNNACFDIIGVDVVQLDDDCYRYRAMVTTTAACIHDLSHLTIAVNNGDVGDVYNSSGWKVEKNMTDPTTGLYGFKIDDIEGFGSTNASFDLEFDICYNNDQPIYEFDIAYKAGLCISTDQLLFKPTNTLKAEHYPNPFIDKTTIEFTVPSSGHAELNIYNINGELQECLFKGNVDANVLYQFDFNPKSKSGIYFYRLICNDEIISGKVVQTTM